METFVAGIRRKQKKNGPPTVLQQVCLFCSLSGEPTFNDVCALLSHRVEMAFRQMYNLGTAFVNPPPVGF